MNNSFKKFFLILTIAGINSAAFAQIQSSQLDGRVNTINTAVPFLRIDPDARSGAMGDVGIGLSPDANSIFWNMAKLSFVGEGKTEAEQEKFGLGATFTPWLKALVNDIYLGYLSGYYKLDKDQALSASLQYFSLGSITFTDYQGQSLGQFNPHELAFSFGYSRKLTTNFSTGVTLKYVYSNLATGFNVNGVAIHPGNAAAGDVSFFYHHKALVGSYKGHYNIGATIADVGNKITYTESAQNKDFLPTNLGIGGALTLEFDKYNTLTIATDINKLLVPTPDSAGDFRTKSVPAGIFGSFGDAPGGFSEEMHELMYSAGVEYWYDNQFAIRAGYFNEHSTKGDRKYLTAGLGVKYHVFGLNFSYLIPTTSNRNPLDNTLRFSLLFDFGAMKGDGAAAPTE